MKETKYRALTIDGEMEYIGLGERWNWKNIVQVMRPTGLVDDEGEDVYEGDILKYSGATNKYLVVRWRETGMFTGFSIAKRSMKHCVVIGNIYQDPDLLK